jgi:hypothetical protein
LTEGDTVAAAYVPRPIPGRVSDVQRRRLDQEVPAMAHPLVMRPLVFDPPLKARDLRAILDRRLVFGGSDDDLVVLHCDEHSAHGIAAPGSIECTDGSRILVLIPMSDPA